MPFRKLLAAGLLFLLQASLAHAALSDEIQVYTDDLTEQGGFGVELHVITLPKGRKEPDYQGESVPYHSLYTTAELSWGLTPTTDIGLYIPGVRDGTTGRIELAGLKGRFKWLPVKGDEINGGWFSGVNFELGNVAHQYNQVRTNLEVRFMAGWRDANWLLGINPVLGYELSDNPAGHPGYGFGLKATRRVAPGIALGTEYYTDRGNIGHTLPWEQQDNRLFLVMDYDRKPWNFNFGIGRGFTHAADKLTIKTIFELPF
ncbi:MAG TPA: hypothetical protein VFW68_02175 [Rhodocyclaceae bacterium]|nr:hypothetical protein [Rhodocyclaceae bacterium]